MRCPLTKISNFLKSGSVKITHRECKNYTSGSVKNTRQDVQKLHGINTNIINTNISNINNNTSEQNSLEKTPTETRLSVADWALRIKKKKDEREGL